MGNKNFCECFEDAVRASIDKYNMIADGDRLLVAYSGGVDSAVLLYVLYSLAERCGISLAAFHLNHGIRGAEADRDEAHCKKICLQLGVEYFSESVSVPEYVKEHGLGTEEAARELRYKLLADCCRKNGYDGIAMAHHADDNLETVIFRLTRGTGMRGLCGIPPVRYEHEIKVIRPLIESVRDDIIKYAENRKISFVTDSSNSDEKYSRNRIRKFVIPELKKINPAVVSSVTKMSRCFSENCEALKMLAELPDSVYGAEKLPDAVIRERMVNEYWRSFQNKEAAMLEAVHIDALLSLYKTGKLWDRVSLPGSVTALKTRNGIEFSYDSDLSSENVFASDRKIKILPGMTFLSDDKHIGGAMFLKQPSEENENCDFSDFPDFSEFSAEDFGSDINIKKGRINIYKLSIHIYVNSDKLKKNIYVRGRADGDCIFTGGMNKRLKKLYQQKKIPPAERNTIPLLCDDDGIIWAPGIAVRDGLCTGSSDNCARAEFFYLPPDACCSIVCEKNQSRHFQVKGKYLLWQ